MKNTEKKKKKEKTVYIDDGSSISDMSGVGGIGRRSPNDKRECGKRSAPRASFKEQFETYIGAVRLMFFPMLVVLGIIALAFLIVYIIL